MLKQYYFDTGDTHLLLPSSVNVDGRLLNFLNDLDVDADGSVYFTDTSRYPRRDFILDLLDGRGNGRLEAVYRNSAHL